MYLAMEVKPSGHTMSPALEVIPYLQPKRSHHFSMSPPCRSHHGSSPGGHTTSPALAVIRCLQPYTLHHVSCPGGQTIYPALEVHHVSSHGVTTMSPALEFTVGHTLQMCDHVWLQNCCTPVHHPVSLPETTTCVQPCRSYPVSSTEH